MPNNTTTMNHPMCRYVGNAPIQFICTVYTALYIVIFVTMAKAPFFRTSRRRVRKGGWDQSFEYYFLNQPGEKYFFPDVRWCRGKKSACRKTKISVAKLDCKKQQRSPWDPVSKKVLFRRGGSKIIAIFVRTVPSCPPCPARPHFFEKIKCSKS